MTLHDRVATSLIKYFVANFFLNLITKPGPKIIEISNSKWRKPKIENSSVCKYLLSTFVEKSLHGEESFRKFESLTSQYLRVQSLQ